MNCRSRVFLSTPIYTNHRYNYKTPDLFSLSRIFTDLIMHNYRSNQSALMTRCGTDFRHQYGIFGGESQTSVSRNATRPGAKKDGCFRRLAATWQRDKAQRDKLPDYRGPLPDVQNCHSSTWPDQTRVSPRSPKAVRWETLGTRLLFCMKFYAQGRMQRRMQHKWAVCEWV